MKDCKKNNIYEEAKRIAEKYGIQTANGQLALYTCPHCDHENAYFFRERYCFKCRKERNKITLKKTGFVGGSEYLHTLTELRLDITNNQIKKYIVCFDFRERLLFRKMS